MLMVILTVSYTIRPLIDKHTRTEMIEKLFGQMKKKMSQVFTN